MGLFDFLSSKKSDSPKGEKRQPSERELARLEKLVSNKLSQNLDRQDAINQLSNMASERAAMILLRRFNWTMDPSITDQEEKEAAVSGIVAAGEAALEPIRSYCEKAESLHWPLKALRQIVSEEHIVEELLGILDQFDTEYLRNPEPKVQLIELLGETPSEDVRVAVEPFLVDASEPVRFAAASTVFAVSNPESVPSLVAALEEEESLRVKNRIAQGLGDRGWTVPETYRQACTDGLPPDFSLSSSGVVKRG